MTNNIIVIVITIIIYIIKLIASEHGLFFSTRTFQESSFRVFPFYNHAIEMLQVDHRHFECRDRELHLK